MVARAKIYKGETPLGELQTAFKEEVGGILKDAALKLKCNVEQLKYRFDNLGRVEVQIMTIEEMVENREKDEERKRVATIHKRMSNG